MIKDSELTVAGRFNKPHGVCGEISASLLYDTLDLKALRCIVVKVDAINVPFFLTDVRPKGRESVLVSIDGFDSEKAVAAFSNKDFYALSAELPGALAPDEADGLDDPDGLYAADLAGFTLLSADGSTVGVVDGLEDSTANVLFIVSRPDGSEVYVPVADELITALDPEARTITMDLPEGLLGL